MSIIWDENFKYIKQLLYLRKVKVNEFFVLSKIINLFALDNDKEFNKTSSNIEYNLEYKMQRQNSSLHYIFLLYWLIDSSKVVLIYL